MPKPRTVYRGKRKYSWIITLAVSLVVVLILLAVWLFYYLQRFIVYDKEGLRLDLSAQQEQLITGRTDDRTSKQVNIPHVDVEIVVDQRDYSQISTSAGTGLLPLHSIYVASSSLNDNTLKYYRSNMGDFDALTLELKTEDGFLHWHSSVSAADSFAVNGTLELSDALAELKAQDVYLVARIGVLSDAAMAQRNSPLALKNSASGAPYTDGKGHYYLDPYDDGTRAYLYSLMSELKSLGFDELLLDGFSFPDSEYLQFSVARTQAPAPVDALMSLALWLREQADALNLRLSVVMDSAALRTGEIKNGQSAELFFKVFDRVAVETSSDAVQNDLAELKTALGTDDEQRMVPITVNFTPSSQSYIVR